MKKILTTLLEKLGFTHAVTSIHVIHCHLEELLDCECSMVNNEEGHYFTLHPVGFEEAIVFDYTTEDSMVKITNIEII